MFTECKHDRSGAACLMQALTLEPVSVGALFTACAVISVSADSINCCAGFTSKVYCRKI